MKKAIRDNRNYPLGWTETSDPKGTKNEFVDAGGFAVYGYVAETLRSLYHDEREYITDIGELH